MPKDDATIVIKADTKQAEETLDTLKKKGNKTFKELSSFADERNKEISNSFKNLGLATQESIKKANAVAKASYERIKNSGTTSAKDIKRAHNAMTAQIRANNKKLNDSNRKTIRLFKALKASIKSIFIGVVGVGFAITRAFDFAKTGGKLKQQELAFRNLADSTGQDADKIIDNLQRISKGTLTTAQVIQSANLAVLLGIPAESLDELMTIARAASKATGDSVQKSFDDIVRGIGRQSRLILDNLGIIVSVLVANEKLAASLGVQAKDLTDTERRQAFLNETMDKGSRIVSIVGDDFKSSADVLAGFTTQLKNAADWLAKVTARITALFIVDIKKGFLFTKRSFQAVTQQIFRLTDAVGLTSDAFKEQQDDLEKTEEALKKLSKTTKDLNKSNEEISDRQREKNRLAREANEQTRKEEEAIIAKRNAEVEALETTIKLEEKKQVTTKTNLDQLKTTTRLSKEAVRVQKKLVADLKTELQGVEDALKNALELIQETERIKTKRRKSPTGAAKIDIAFAQDDIDKVRRLIEAGDVAGAKDLASKTLQLLQEVSRAENISRRVIEDADALSQVVVDLLFDMKDTIQQTIELELKKELELEGVLADDLAGIEAFKLGIKSATREAKKLKDELKEAAAALSNAKAGGGDGTGRSTAGAKRMKDGGRVGTGFGGGDQHSILGESGEFMLRKEAVRNLGEANVNAINNLQTPDLGGTNNNTSVNVNLNVGGKQVSLQGSGKEVDKLVKEIKNINIKSGRYESRY